MEFDKIYNNAERFFSNQVKVFGRTAEGVGWNGTDAQRIRYDQITKLLDNVEGEFSILDFGCGYGYYLDYLKTRYSENKQFRYYGADVSKEMVEQAILMHQEDVSLGSFFNGTQIEGEYDYIVSSGIFNLKQDVTNELWQEYIIDTIHMFDRHSRRGFAFNALTKYSDADKMRTDLFYADPLYLFDYCKTHFSRNVALLHDYEIYDFTIIVRR